MLELKCSTVHNKIDKINKEKVATIMKVFLTNNKFFLILKIFFISLLLS